MPHAFPNPPPHLRGTVTTLEHTSQVLQDNPWKDPYHRDLHVYTPPGYETHPDTGFPVVLVLAPYSGTGESLLGRTLTEMSLATRIDRLIHGQDCPPFIAVLPDAMSSLGGTQYVDSPGLGQYATWLVDEIMPFVDQRFRTNGHWGVMGRSSGGFGALHLAMSHPGRFQGVACHSGDMGFDLSYLSGLHEAVAAIHAAGGPRAFVESFWEGEQVSGRDFAALSLLCISAAYTDEPGPAADGFPARLPIDFDTGAVDFEVLGSWRRYDPVVRARKPEALDALRQLDLLFIDAGSRDEYLLHLAARRFVSQLEDADVDHIYEEHPAGHRGTSFRYDRSLPLLAHALTP